MTSPLLVWIIRKRLRQRLDVEKEPEGAGLLNAQQELEVDRTARRYRRAQRDCACRER